MIMIMSHRDAGSRVTGTVGGHSRSKRRISCLGKCPALNLKPRSPGRVRALTAYGASAAATE